MRLIEFVDEDSQDALKFATQAHQGIATAKSPAWRARYKAETEHIMNYIEKNRQLSGTHKKLVSLIRDKLNEIPTT
jgi:hypothetical protein